MEQEEKHLTQESIDRLNKIIVDLNVDQLRFVDSIKELGTIHLAAKIILDSIIIVENYDGDRDDVVLVLAELLGAIHPLIYRSNDYADKKL